MSATGFNRRRRELAAAAATAELKPKEKTNWELWQSVLAQIKAEEAKAANGRETEQRDQKGPEIKTEQTAASKPKQTSESEENLEAIAYNDLRAMAKEAGIEGYGKMKKDELIAALKG